ncbi:MAG: hypothetical protein K9I85_06020 [Saprospiraceae bacterium]|nr:hypothetical protein [Saprospiraceae bacterium]
MKYLLTLILAIMMASAPISAQITFTSDSTFMSHDTSWVQLDTMNVSGTVWYTISSIQIDQSGNQVITTYQPRTKKQMREYVREGIEQSNQTIQNNVKEVDAARSRKQVFTAIRDALKGD